MKFSELWKRHGFAVLAFLAILIVILISASIPAKAAGTSATVSWTHPTLYTDGTPLALTDITETIVIWRRPGNATVIGSIHVAAPATQTLVTGLVCGNFNVTAVTVTNSGASSAETAPVAYATGIVCAPNPPTNLKVT